jgi:signal transduction histidine kinase/CheY-like chemotaxis protein/HPt (histidine-containing phosphotransfer) domain-containing protein
MTSPQRFLLIAVALTAGFVLLSYSILRAIVYPSYAQLENQVARIEVNRTLTALDEVKTSLDLTNIDWAQWTDSYEYARTPNPAYEKENLRLRPFQRYDVDLVMIFNESAELVWGGFADQQAGKFVPLDAILSEIPRAGDPLLSLAEPETSITGLLETKLGPMIISSRPITTGDATKIGGTMIMGRLLDAELVTSLQQSLDSNFRILYKRSDSIAADRDALAARASTADGELFHAVRGDLYLTYKSLSDARGDPEFLLEVELPRSITATGATTVRLAGLFLALAGIVFSFALWLMFRRLIAAEGQRFAMREARDTAIEIARLKSEFLATMSHEMRTPMNGVIGLTDLLLDTPLAPQQKLYAEDIQGSASSLLAIINDVLDFSKIESGRMEIESRVFELRALVEDAIALFGPSAAEKGLELVTSFPLALDAAWRGDPGRLRQILINLLGNAVRFTRRGEVALHVSLAGDGADASRVRFEVRDTGIGIAAEKQRSIFDSFTQLDASTTREFGGTGLGLAISKRLVELMGGEIGVESTPDRGSVFWFEVPLERGGALDTADAPVAQAFEELWVLVADENPDTGEALRAQFAAWGAHCQLVHSGPAALERLCEAATREAPFDLALVDQEIPEMDGASLAHAIRSAPALSALPLILMSPVPERAVEALPGVCVQLRKPVRKTELVACLEAVFPNEFRRTPAAGTGPDPTGADARALQAHVLLAEDNLVNQRVATAMLERMGCRVDVVADGRAALAALTQADYDAVLMDCQMPVMDGYDATAEIRRGEAAREPARRVPILALTANAIDGDRERCLNAGMDDYLSKPFRSAELRATLERWLAAPSPTLREAAPAPAAGAASAPQAADHGPLDKAALDMIRELQQPGAEDLLSRVVHAYLDSAPELIEDLETGLVERDTERARGAAHTLKSSSASVGAARLASLCREIETRARNGQLSQAKDLLDPLLGEYRDVVSALEAVLASASA